MSETVLTAKSGRTTGSAAARRLRTADEIPAVLYGMGMEPISLSVDRADLRHALSGSAGLNTVLDLTVDGTVYPAIIKDLQRHRVRRSITHVDFIQINLTAEITVNVPVHLTGEAEEVIKNNGLVDPTVDHLEVVTTPRNIPDQILIDISEMTMDSVIRLEDINLPDGVVATADPETTLVTVLFIKEEELEPVAAEGEEGVEGEGEAEGEGAAAEGAPAGEAAPDGAAGSSDGE